MNSPKLSGSLIAILPCNDLDASERFYSRLGFRRSERREKPIATACSQTAKADISI